MTDNSKFYMALDKKWAIEDFPMKEWEPQPLTYRRGFVHNWFSNFEWSPITIGDVFATTVEHYYQAMKTNSPMEQQNILCLKTPGAAKRAGRGATMRGDWEKVKWDFMYQALLHKCMGYPNFLTKLKEAGEIVEWNNWNDTTWGANLNGRGRNALGVQLMHLRDNL